MTFLIVIFALVIAGACDWTFEDSDLRGYLNLANLVLCAACVFFVLHFKPSWKEHWQLVTVAAELVCLAISSIVIFYEPKRLPRKKGVQNDVR